jgi:hypothetical protein
MALEPNTGSTTITTLGTIGTGVWGGTAIPANKGGTALTAFTNGSLLYASAANVWSALASSTNQAILQISATGYPSWVASTSLPYATISHTQAATAGGTGLTSFTNGSLLYASAANTWSALASSTAGQVLWISATGYPAWTATSTLGLGGGGAQTPWTSNIAGGGYNLTGVGLASTTSFTTVNATSSASLVVGADGAAQPGCLAIQDTDSAGWTYCTTLNGTMSCSATNCSGAATSTLQIGR